MISIGQAITIFTFIFGLVVGSFLNVLIVRLPLEKSIFLPRSHCPHCGKVIPWYNNIPLLSYLVLRGKCSVCNVSIPLTYPLVELITALGALLLLRPLGDPVSMFHSMVLFSSFCVFVCHFIIDLRHRILPNILNVYLALLFLLYGVFFLHWKFILLGGLVGFFIPYSLAKGYYLLRGEEGFGGGDIKLYGALGLYLGAQGVAINMFLSCLLGSLVALFLILAKRMDKKTPIPFGPFIILVASGQIFFPQTIQKYLSTILFMS